MRTLLPSAPGKLPAEVEPDVLRFPSGTTMQFTALVAAVALTSAFAGNWMYLSVREPADPLMPPTTWLGVPPAIVLAVGLGLTLAAPRWLERRHRWTVLSEERGACALERYGTLVAASGLHATPSLMWNDADGGSRALAYGIPGAYRVAVTPALVGAARRHPDRFDAVLLHELAHIRHRDVAFAYFALCVWYALLPAVALPLAWRVLDHDLSLVPEYLLRVGCLVIVVYVIRAAVLRSREHYADVRAARSAVAATTLSDLFNAPPSSPHGVSRILSLHPPPPARARVVAEPARLAAIAPPELFLIGLTAAWSLPLLEEVIAGGETSEVLRAAQLSRWVVFGLLGAYAGAILARWAGVTAARSGIGYGAAALVAGVTMGSVISIANTGTPFNPGADVASAAVTGLACGGYFCWAAHLAEDALRGRGGARLQRLRIASCIAVTALVYALLADTTLAVSEFIRLGGPSAMSGTVLIEAVSSRTAPLMLMGVVMVVGVAAGFLTRARPLRASALGAAVGLLAVFVLAAVHLRTRQGAGVLDPTAFYYTAVVWAVVAAAVATGVIHGSQRPRRRLTIALPCAGITVVVASATFVVVENVGFGSSLRAADFWQLCRDAGSVGMLLVPIAASLAWAVFPLVGGDERRRLRVSAGLIALTSCFTIAVMPGAVTRQQALPSAEHSELADYLANEVQLALIERDSAVHNLGVIPQGSPDATAKIRTVVVAQYDIALRYVETPALISAAAVRVQEAIQAFLQAERTQTAVLADVIEGQVPWSRYDAASASAVTARRHWIQVLEDTMQELAE